MWFVSVSVSAFFFVWFCVLSVLLYERTSVCACACRCTYRCTCARADVHSLFSQVRHSEIAWVNAYVVGVVYVCVCV